jgi:hypothetical protein
MVGAKYVSAGTGEANPTSVVRILETFTACRETGRWQQEWEAGITVESQLCAIALQQICSAGVIWRSGTMHAMTGIATTAMTRKTAANCEALRNISIISKPSAQLCDRNHERAGYVPKRCHLKFSFSRTSR